MSEAIYRIRLHLHGPVHWWSRPASYQQKDQHLPSDGLKNALLVTYLQLYGAQDPAAFMDRYRLSSAFPWQGEHCFLPAPLGARLFDAGTGNEKKARKVRWLSEECWRKVMQGEKLRFDDGLLSDNFYGMDPSNEKPGPRRWMQEKVNTQKVYEEGNPLPYLLERKDYGANGGLYFLVSCDEEALKELQKALRLLGDEGLGSYRNLGNGQFTASAPERWEPPQVAAAERALCLGLYIPPTGPETVALLQGGYYQLRRRGGHYCANPADKSLLGKINGAVYMLEEGSHLPATAAGGLPPGQRVDLSPRGAKHPVWRDGHILSIPYHLSV